MNWKLKLTLVLTAISALAIFAKFSSDAKIFAQSSDEAENTVFQKQKAVKYENGTMRLEAQSFGVSGAVRDMPSADPNSLMNRATFVSRRERRKKRDEARTKKGESFLSQLFGFGDDEEINKLNSARLKKILPGAGAGDDDFIDPLLERAAKSYAPQAMPTPSLTFNGASAVDNNAQGIGGVTPPDTNGDVGPNHYVSSVNLVLKMFNKSGGVVAGPIRTSAIFQSLPAGDPCRTLNDGDPIVLYDSLADRWHISQFAVPDGNLTYQCVALSTTGDPTGSYYVWSYGYPIQAFNDYPKVGVWTDAYHMTFNQFGINSGYLGIGILSQDRAKALVGDPSAAAVYINLGAIDENTGGSLPGDIDGLTAPPVGMAQVIGEYRANEYVGSPVDGVRMYKWVPDFINPNNSSLTVLGDVQLAPFDGRQPPGRNHIEVLGGVAAQFLDSVADRSMHRFAYRNFGTIENPINSYVGNFSVNVSGVRPTSAATYQTGIRWFEMRRGGDSFSVFDQGTHNLSPGDGANGLNNWVGSIAQDNRGNIALGFSQAGTTQRADIKIAGRTNNFQNSGTLNEGEALLHAAGGIQTSNSARWGDYSAMSVDPSDDCTFWYTQQYYATDSTSGWSTRVGKFRYPQCTDAPKATIQGAVTFCDTGAPVAGASVTATGGFNRLTDANGLYSLMVSPGNYTLNAAKNGGFTASGSQNVSPANGQTANANFCVNRVALVASETPQITSESCGTANNTPDPGELITVSLPLRNTGSAAASNLTATLQASGGIVSPSAAQSYGALAPSAAATRNFTFRVDSSIACGATVTLTFSVADGATNYGTITQQYTTGVPTVTLSENFDGVTAPALPAGWTSAPISGTPVNWATNTTPASSTPNSAFAPEPTTPSTSALVSPPIQIQQANAQLTFKNWFHTEETYDGMVLEFSTDNGGNWTDVITGGGSFVRGGYTTIISRATDSTIAGRRAWSGISGVGTAPTFVDTTVNLPASLNGQTVRFRWVAATDSGTAVSGVRVDDVRVFGARVCNVCANEPTVCSGSRPGDFDGDKKADISLFRPSDRVWYIANSGGSGVSYNQFGLATDKITPADFDGDGKADIAVFRPETGVWFILKSAGGVQFVQFGAAEDLPMPADFDGNGKAEVAVFRPSIGVWFILNTETFVSTATQFGAAEDKPVAADYNGDGKAELAVYRPSTGVWFLLNAAANQFTSTKFGISTDKPVVGDYDGDCKADIAVYRPTDGNWYLLQSTAGYTVTKFGLATDLPTPADFDGDGKTDIAVFRPSEGNWYLLQSQQGFNIIRFGLDGDRPTPNAYVR